MGGLQIEIAVQTILRDRNDVIHVPMLTHLLAADATDTLSSAQHFLTVDHSTLRVRLAQLSAQALRATSVDTKTVTSIL